MTGPACGSPLLEIEDLTVEYATGGTPSIAVDSVSLEIFRGETLCVVGESGCGKSTLAMALPRLLPEPTATIRAKSIRFLGKELSSMDRSGLRALRGDRIGVIFQEPMTALSPLHRVGSQIEEAFLMHRGREARGQARSVALEWLSKVGIADPSRVALAYPHELSGGMQQRIMIAMALVNDPDLVIADEPTTALDATTQTQVLELMKRLVSGDRSLLLITHDMGVVRRMATRVAVMYAGLVVEMASCADLFARPTHPYTRALLASMPTLETRGRRLPTIEGFVPTPEECARMRGCRFLPRCAMRDVCAGDDASFVFADEGGSHLVRCCNRKGGDAL